MNSRSPRPTKAEAFHLAVMILCEVGHKVRPAIDAPGFFRIDNGEERSAEEIIEAALHVAQERLTMINQ